jgi:hypothetical protein
MGRVARRQDSPRGAPAAQRPPAPLVPGQAPPPAELDETRRRLLSGAAGRPNRITPPAQLPEPLFDCDVFITGWWSLLGEAALAVHTVLCRRPQRGPSRPAAGLDELRGVHVGEVLTAPIPPAGDAPADVAGALDTLAAVPAGPLGAAVEKVVFALTTLGLAVADGDRVWCACSSACPPPGGARKLPTPPTPAELGFPADLAGFSTARALAHRTDRSSAPFWAFLPGDDPPDLETWSAAEWQSAVHRSAEIGAALTDCGRGVVSVRPADLTVEFDDSQSPPNGVRLALIIAVDWPALRRAGMLPDAELRVLIMAGVAVCDDATDDADIATATIAVLPAGWQPAVRHHLDRLAARGGLHAALTGRSLAELAADAGCSVHADDLARSSLEQRTAVVANTSAALLLHECTEPDEHISPFGVAEAGDNSWLDAAAPLVGMPALGTPASVNPVQRLATVHAALDYDRLVLEAGGRWPDRHRPRPATEPGDAVALRTFGVDQQLQRWATWSEEMNAATAFAGQEPIADQAVEIFALAPLLAQAVPFFLPAAVAAGVADSLPPDAQTLATLTLPHPVCLLTLGAPMLLAPRSEHWSGHLLPDLAAWDDVMSTAPGVRRRGPTASAAAVVSSTRLPLLAALWRFGALVDGVVLVADLGGGVRDECLWCVRVPDPDDAAATLGHAVLPGRIGRSAFTDPVANLATVLAVSDWQQPTGALPGLPGSNEFRRALRRGSFHDAERSGGAGGVRVLRLPDPDQDADPLVARAAPEAPPGRQVRTHLRRGHWRRVRTGPRDGWQYRTVLILPTVVNAGASDWRGLAVYRVPEPGETRDEGDLAKL